MVEALPAADLLALREALEKLKSEDPLKAELVERHCVAGQTGDQAAEVLGISVSIADRHSAFVRAWLKTEGRGV